MSSLQPGARIGPYRIESVLPGNRGGFAQVVVARRVSSGSEHDTVAIKLARTDDVSGLEAESFARALGSEVETLRMLKHPGIVRIYPVQLDDRRYSYMVRAENLPGSPWYFVMEHLTGGTAEDLVRKQGALTPALAVEISHQVGVALDYIHTSGYAHLDIKTNNIAFRRPLAPDKAPEAVLIDFGAAQKALRRAEVEAGALMYLPPERVQVLLGERAPETIVNKPAADVYALGITLYRMLTGELPFRGARDHVTTAILTRAPTHPMQINRDLVKLTDLDALIMQMLEKDPSRRPGIKEILTRLDQAVAPPRFDGVGIAEASRPAPGRGWKAAALALAALVIVEGAGLGYLGLVRSDAPPVATMVPVPDDASVVPAVEPGLTPPALPVTSTPSRTATRTAPPTRSPTAAPTHTSTHAPAGIEPTIVPTYTSTPTRPPRPTAVPTKPVTPASPAPAPTPGIQP